MESEFPDPEDEYDLMHADEYEILREFELSEKQKSAPIFQKPCEANGLQTNVIESNSIENNVTASQNTNVAVSQGVDGDININGVDQEQITNGENHQSDSFQFLSQCDTVQSEKSDLTRKRSIDQVPQNSSTSFYDLTFDDYSSALPDKKKPRWDRPKELIQMILDRRKKNEIISNQSFETSLNRKRSTDSISKRVPLCNFVAVTRHDNGERFYVKVVEKSRYSTEKYRPTSRFFTKSFDIIKDEAEKIILKQVEQHSLPPVRFQNQKNATCELWVDKYKPKRYLELLSDESVNRSLLRWLKLWDKMVFDRDPTVRPKKTQPTSKFQNKFKKKDEDVPDHDSKGFPTYRIALLTGPPGLGKTTLAHVAARHAGYKIVELNASDDRGPEAFREALLSSTQMRAVMDEEKRPNCLILDEIDGAASASIELLLKFIHGKLVPKGKGAKNKTQKDNDGCRRPIICICNDLYAPSLRPLRSMALVLNVPEVDPSSLADRLSEVARNEGLKVDPRVLRHLAEKSGCDVRACLGILQYTGGGSDMMKDLASSLRDTKKGLFDAWRDMLKIPRNRQGALSNHQRSLNVITLVHQAEPERLLQGIFHNYPESCNGKMDHVSESLLWFEFHDIVNTVVMERQTWQLMPYTTSAFIAWHLYLADSQNPKITFPSILFEVNQKKERNLAILTATKKTSKYDILTLVTEVLPYLPDLLSPQLRSVNAQLYSVREKEELKRLVNLMLDFGLTFTQERKPGGGYEYYLDPNIWDIGTFPDCRVRKQLAYAVKQIVIQELETERLQRAAAMSDDAPASTTGTTSNQSSKASSNKSSGASTSVSSVPMDEDVPSSSQPSSSQNVPNHLRQQLNPVELKPSAEKKCRNFFKAFQQLGQEKRKQKIEQDKLDGIVQPETNTQIEKEKLAKKTGNIFKSDYWYQYKEGYSNAVRRTVLMKDLLK
ncbi:hypothetical protein QAD02_023134 [Eretmocerus hayati]|uniref:Uncharacterized protein n=1 Tax=Eretmocerus hayati TaxID=131215 RepID=A0ACC2PUR8_9HYME|nr:hypothetical protein QAD02_023134 [Eretmocerus hayati]